jgi:hypothetical protein
MPISIGLADQENRKCKNEQPPQSDLKEEAEDSESEVEEAKSKPGKELASKPGCCESGDNGDSGEGDEGNHCSVKSLAG